MASDLQRIDIAQLNPEALGNIKKLSVSPRLVSTARSLPLTLAFVGLCGASPDLTLLSTVSTVPLSLSLNSQEELGCGSELGNKGTHSVYISEGYRGLEQALSWDPKDVLRSHRHPETVIPQHQCASLSPLRNEFPTRL